MSILDKLKETMPDLHSADVSNTELFDKNIDYTRDLSEYPTADKIATFLLEHGNKGKHIYTKDLNVNGVAVQDAMDKYLEKDAYQSSNLKQALLTPLHLEFSLDDDKSTLAELKGKQKHFELGTYLHECILEPTKFSRVVVEPNEPLSSHDGANKLMAFWEKTLKDHEDIDHASVMDAASCINGEGVLESITKDSSLADKKKYIALLKQYSGLSAVSAEHFLKIQILKRHYDNYGGGILKELLRHSKREISFYMDHESGLNLKVRPDAIQFEENIGVNAVISIKSTGMEDLRAFCYDAARKNYDLSEGMYQEVVSTVTGRDFNTTIMVMLQTVAPFGIAVLVWSAEDIETGKYKFREALEIAKKCKESDSYKGYEAFAEDNTFGLIQMELPSWNQKQFLPTN